MAEENQDAVGLVVRQSKTRFHYAVGSTLLTFGYMAITPPEFHAPAWGFLMVVAGGFGVAKASEHLKLK